MTFVLLSFCSVSWLHFKSVHHISQYCHFITSGCGQILPFNSLFTCLSMAERNGIQWRTTVCQLLCLWGHAEGGCSAPGCPEWPRAEAAASLLGEDGFMCSSGSEPVLGSGQEADTPPALWSRSCQLHSSPVVCRLPCFGAGCKKGAAAQV